jgi:hypothetical protein
MEKWLSLLTSITLVYKIFFFSVTSTKVVKLNSIFYAECKYVLSFSLSRKVFKWHTLIIWRKLTFTCYISVFLHYLKSNCGWFPAVCHLWNISLEGPAVVKQHWGSTCPGTAFPCLKCPDEISFHVRHWRHQDSQGRSLSESLRNVLLGTYYIP